MSFYLRGRRGLLRCQRIGIDENGMTVTAPTISLPQFADADRVTHSSESAFKACPRRYQHAYVYGLKPSHDSDALRVGSAVHTGLESLKNGGSEADAVKAIRDAYADANCPPWLDDKGFEVERETATALVRGWGERYAGDAIVRYVAVEMDFDLPLVNPHTGRPHPTVRNAGKIDGIAELPDGRIALVEHKTSSEDVSPGSDYWRRLMLDAQISRYWLAARDLGFPVETVVYDVIRKPLIRPKKVAKMDRHRAVSEGHYHGSEVKGFCPEAETPAMFGARLLAAIREDPGWYFARNEVPRLATDLEQFRLDQWAVLRAIQSCEMEGYYPRHTNACTQPYRCTFLDVCRGLCGDPAEQVPAGFKVTKRLHAELNTGRSAGKEQT